MRILLTQEGRAMAACVLLLILCFANPGIDAFQVSKPAPIIRALVESHATVLDMASASTSDTSTENTANGQQQQPALTEFVSPMYQVYIEDTDAYGVIYNSNYLRSYDRALHAMYVLREQDMTPNGSAGEKMSILDHHDWSIVHVQDHKFKSSPKLGGLYCVHGTLVEVLDNNMEVWDLEMRESEQPDSTVFNSARVTLARPSVFTTPRQNLFEQTKGDAATKNLFRLFRDEFDSHSTSHLPIRTVLNLFERSRTNFLGGPDALRKLKEEDGLLFVVSKIDDLCLSASETSDQSEPGIVTPGLMTLVQTNFEVKRKGMVLECYQTLKSANQPLAQGRITLMTLDAKSFRPTSNLPNWLWELLEQSNY